MAGGKFDSVPDVIGQNQGKGDCRSTGGKRDPRLKGSRIVIPFLPSAPSQGWASSLIHFH